MSAFERFHEKWISEPNTGCWLWTAGRSGGKRYGVMAFNGKPQLAHRISFILHKGKFPENLYVCHKCDVGLCVNPDHLFLGTQKDNMNDCQKKGRFPSVLGSKNPRARINEEQVLKIKELFAAGHSRSELSKKYNISKQSVNRLLRGATWANV